MYQKNCYGCYRSSFSSDRIGKWMCPICGEDLSVQRSLPPLLLENVCSSHSGRKVLSYQFVKNKTSSTNKII